MSLTAKAAGRASQRKVKDQCSQPANPRLSIPRTRAQPLQPRQPIHAVQVFSEDPCPRPTATSPSAWDTSGAQAWQWARRVSLDTRSCRPGARRKLFGFGSTKKRVVGSSLSFCWKFLWFVQGSLKGTCSSASWKTALIRLGLMGGQGRSDLFFKGNLPNICADPPCLLALRLAALPFPERHDLLQPSPTSNPPKQPSPANQQHQLP